MIWHNGCSAMDPHAMKSLNAIHNQKVSCQKSESSPCWALCCGVPAMFILPLALVHQHNFHLTLLGMWMWLPVTSSSYSKQIQTEGLSFWQRGGNPACRKPQLHGDGPIYAEEQLSRLYEWENNNQSKRWSILYCGELIHSLWGCWSTW